MTHRAFSRNASSSRAIPVARNLEEVRSDELRAAPVWWGREQKGMQSGEELDDERHPGADMLPANEGGPGSDRYSLYGVSSPRDCAKACWDSAALQAVDIAEELVAIGVHKSIVNRILEPFLHINVVATSCEPGLLNFFGLRLDRAAQPEIRVLAEQMWAAWNESEPRKLEPGQWHLPFVDEAVHYDIAEAYDLISDDDVVISMVKSSVARCARVSYLSYETGRRSTIEEDMALYDHLVGAQPLHASPAEHQATPDRLIDVEIQIDMPYDEDRRTTGHILAKWEYREQHGNLYGWRQYRKTLPGEAVAPLPEGYAR